MINVAIIEKKKLALRGFEHLSSRGRRGQKRRSILVSSATALHALTNRATVFNVPRGECQISHAIFSETKAHALKRSDTFYTLDPSFRINHGSSNSVFYSSRHLLVRTTIFWYIFRYLLITNYLFKIRF